MLGIEVIVADQRILAGLLLDAAVVPKPISPFLTILLPPQVAGKAAAGCASGSFYGQAARPGIPSGACRPHTAGPPRSSPAVPSPSPPGLSRSSPLSRCAWVPAL